MRFSVGSTRTGKTTPSSYLHKQLDVTPRPARLLGQEAACYNRSVRFVAERGAPWERGPLQIISLRTYREWPGIDGAVPSCGCWPGPGRAGPAEARREVWLDTVEWTSSILILN